MESKKIYVELIEGTKSLVPLPAETTDEGYYRILENPYLDLLNDVTSIWKFFPGDVVKCDLQDDMLVATELISSSFPDRRLHQLAYLIVEGGEDTLLNEQSGSGGEIEILCSRLNKAQPEHQALKAWAAKNCNKN